MQKLSTIITAKRKRLETVRGLNRCTNNKFVTTVNIDDNKDNDNNDNNNNDDEKKKEVKKEKGSKCDKACYSFGFKYYYWDSFKNNNEIEKWG